MLGVPQRPLAQLLRVLLEVRYQIGNGMLVLSVDWDALEPQFREHVIYRRLAAPHEGHQALVIYGQHALIDPADSADEAPLPVVFVPLLAETLDAQQRIREYAHPLVAAVPLARLAEGLVQFFVRENVLVR